jgi:hypothetical protein
MSEPAAAAVVVAPRYVSIHRYLKFNFLSTNRSLPPHHSAGLTKIFPFSFEFERRQHEFPFFSSFPYLGASFYFVWRKNHLFISDERKEKRRKKKNLLTLTGMVFFLSI